GHAARRCPRVGSDDAGAADEVERPRRVLRGVHGGPDAELDGTVTGPHELVNPPTLSRPWGFSHAVVAAPGTAVYVAGQTAEQRDGSIVDDLVEQFDAAAANVVEALAAAGASPDHLVSMQIFTTDLAEYLQRARD